MKLELEVPDTLCITNHFYINGVRANSRDFGNGHDASPEEAEPCGCGNWVFERQPPGIQVLEKYEISEDEYTEIAKELEEKLSFGRCGLCVPLK